MYSKKIQLKLFKDSLQPSIAILKLTKEEYDDLMSWKQDDYDLYLIDEDNHELICQLCSIGSEAALDDVSNEYNLFILVDRLAFNEDEKVFNFSIAKRDKLPSELDESNIYNPWAKTRGVFFDNQEGTNKVIVVINGGIFTRYLYSKDLMKPYFYPLIGPYGKTLVQDAPDDHLHHHALWWGHDGVNGHQLYHEFRGEGRQKHNKFLALFGGPVLGQITAVIDWVTPKDELLIKETRTMRIYNLPHDYRYVDIVSRLHAIDKDIEFSDTKEGGFPFIRVNEQINGNHTGIITSSNGQTGEQEIYGQEADWVDYSGGILNGRKIIHGEMVKNFLELGIAVFLHPESDDYPAKWFVRNYGPFTSSNFHFTNGYLLKAGDTFTFKQRIFLHKGNAEDACVSKRYEEYKNPLTANWSNR